MRRSILTARSNDSVLTVREGPGVDYEAIGYVMEGDPYEIIEEVDGWYKIKLDDGDGYVNSDYIKMIRANVEKSIQSGMRN